MLKRLRDWFRARLRRPAAAPPMSFSALQAEARTRARAAANPGAFFQQHGVLPPELMFSPEKGQRP